MYFLDKAFLCGYAAVKMLELSDQLLQLIEVLTHLLFDVVHFQLFEAVFLFCFQSEYYRLYYSL